MRVPSATGFVFASLALSGSALAIPTPASPHPGSPNPNALDSPRLADSPSFNSPLLSGTPRAMIALPAIREGSGRRRSIPRFARRASQEKKAKQVRGLGVAPLMARSHGFDTETDAKAHVGVEPRGLGLFTDSPPEENGAYVELHLDGVGDVVDDLLGDPEDDRRAFRRQTPSAPQDLVGGLTATLDETLRTVEGTVGSVRGTLRRRLSPDAVLPVPQPDLQADINNVKAATPLAGINPSTTDPASNLPIDPTEAGNYVPAPVTDAAQTVTGTGADSMGNGGSNGPPPAVQAAQAPSQAIEDLPITIPVSLPVPGSALRNIANMAKATGGGAPGSTSGVVDAAEGPATAGGGSVGTAAGMTGSAGGPANTVVSVVGGLPSTVQGTLSDTVGQATSKVPRALPDTGTPVDGILKTVFYTIKNTPAGPALATVSDNANGMPVNTVAKTFAGLPAGGMIKGLTGATSDLPVGDMASNSPVGGVISTVTGLTSNLPIDTAKSTAGQLTGMASTIPAGDALRTAQSAVSGSPIGAIPDIVTGAASGIPLDTVTGVVGKLPLNDALKTASGTPAGAILNSASGTAGGMVGKLSDTVGGAPITGGLLGGALGSVKDTTGSVIDAASGVPMAGEIVKQGSDTVGASN